MNWFSDFDFNSLYEMNTQVPTKPIMSDSEDKVSKSDYLSELKNLYNKYSKVKEKEKEKAILTDAQKQKVEEVFLDCAWACLEGDKKDYENAIKYISLTNFNPFEFIYMFYEALYVKIIHSDKEKEIKDRKKENI